VGGAFTRLPDHAAQCERLASSGPTDRWEPRACALAEGGFCSRSAAIVYSSISNYVAARRHRDLRDGVMCAGEDAQAIQKPCMQGVREARLRFEFHFQKKRKREGAWMIGRRSEADPETDA